MKRNWQGNKLKTKTHFFIGRRHFCRQQLLPKFLTNHTHCLHVPVSQKDCCLNCVTERLLLEFCPKTCQKIVTKQENTDNKLQMLRTWLLCVSVPQTNTDSLVLTQIEWQCSEILVQKRAPSANRTAPWSNSPPIRKFAGRSRSDLKKISIL